MSNRLRRRQFLTGALGLAAAAVAGCGSSAPPRASPRWSSTAAHGSGGERGFPSGFLWGTATSAYQIEGAVDEDGRGPSIWDAYVRMPGKILHGDNADIANDHYHRYRDDVRLMKELGTNAYRFSIAWPRIFPEGTGAPNERGIDFYSRLVDELLHAGIQPHATLYHWDLPQALQERVGGWRSRETSQAFADYAGLVAKRLSDRVRSFFTMNEISSFIDMGYHGVDSQAGGETVRIELAPGLQLAPAELNQARHHAVLAHGLAVQAIRAQGRAGTRCGPADNANIAVPLIDAPEHVKAAEIATRELNAPCLTAMLEGRYLESYLAKCGADAPRVTEADLRAIAAPIDFVGINVYRPACYVLASDQAPGYREIPLSASHPRMSSSWHVLDPAVSYWAPRHVRALWGNHDLYITENGCAASDEPAADGRVYDTDRIMFLRANLAQLQRAIGEGAPVKGYFLWSLMDDFEWSAGYGARFGLLYVDYRTQQRTPKLSADFYRRTIAMNSPA